ncbi:hypothetical protein PGTUg99_020513 [Puccinia graminis f. sp. tritici]|uniref:Uncharacterized protein n=1 Tax=Puccinia graminis f. sp. tritici TaxID=56615 RepID=A0A5B0SIN4_PUCGR|nr:hypothetical protein PGTUg99_020513 [Puccinia graminis f. sp. tritici]
MDVVASSPFDFSAVWKSVGLQPKVLTRLLCNCQPRKYKSGLSSRQYPPSDHQVTEQLSFMAAYLLLFSTPRPLCNWNFWPPIN